MTQVDLKAGMSVNLIKINEKDPQVSANGTDILPISDPVTGAIKKITVNNLLGSVSGGVGNAVPATTPTAGVNTYRATAAGTYTNFSGIVVSSGDLTSSLVYLETFNAGVSWSKRVVPVTVTVATVLDPSNTTSAQSGLSVANYVGANAMSKPVTKAIGTGFDTSFNGVSASDVSTRILYTPFGVNGDITKISIRSARSGTLQCGVFSRSGDTFTLVGSAFNLTLSTSLNIFTSGLPTDVHSDYYLGWYVNNPTSAAVAYKVITADTWNYTGTGMASGVVFTHLTTIDFGIQVEVTTKNTDSEIINAQLPYIKNDGLDVSTFVTNSTSSATRIMADPILIDGTIANLKTNFARGGYMKFKICTKNTDGTFNVISEKEVKAELGVNNLELNMPVSKGQFLGFWHGADAFIGYTAVTATWYTAATDLTGTNNAVTITTTVNFGITFDVIPRKLSSVVKDTPSAVSARPALQKIGIINKSSFLSLSLPSGWVNTTGFIPTTSGLQSPASGSWATVTYLNKFVVLDEDYTSAKVVINDVTTIFSLVRTSAVAQGQGTAIEVNGTNKTMNLYTVLSDIGATPSSIVKTVSIPAFTAGREYHIRIKKVSQIYHFSFYDTVAQIETILKWDAVGTPTDIGMCWNGPGIVFRQGDILIREVFLSSPLPSSVSIFVAGDSLTEGNTIRSIAGGGYMNRWVGHLATAVNNNIAIVARAGETSTQFNSKLSDITTWFKSIKYAIYAIGINDTSFATWQSNMLAFKAVVEAKGAELILCTLFPRTGTEAFCTQVTNYIITSGIRYIDDAQSFTVGGDRVTRDDSWFLSDHLHLTPAGHLRKFNQIKIDVPDLIY